MPVSNAMKYQYRNCLLKTGRQDIKPINNNKKQL